MKKVLLYMLLALCSTSSMLASNVKVSMNSTSPTMTLVNKATGDTVDVGVTADNVYTFDAAPGTYVLTALAPDGTTVNGTIDLNVTEEDSLEFIVFTNQVYATNRTSEKIWQADDDYTVEVDVMTREGVKQTITVGNSTTAGRKTFLALNGNSYYARLIPNAAHQAEGYMTLNLSGTLTYGVTVSGAIPLGGSYTVTLPANAHFAMATKTAHYIPFHDVAPTDSVINGAKKQLVYQLAVNQVYNYRTWREGGLTQAGYFSMKADSTKRPELVFTDADYQAFGPHAINHDTSADQGYETGDILVNINERGHLQMNIGDSYDARAFRSWQLTDTQVNNYFIEPDFHYTVLDLDGNPSTGVITIDNANTTTNPWSTIKAVDKGTAIVLVTYDAIGVNYYRNGKTAKIPYMGGEYWGAIWPENTAAYVVSVGDNETAMDPNMLINEKYNEGQKKQAGKYVDAEHDVFYYLDTEEGCCYTFTPTGVDNVTIAYPAIGERMATYHGFSADGVTKNEDGSYTLLLKEGRQIVRLTDAAGNSIYQVLTAKKCHREIENVSRPGSQVFQPGDKVKIQYSGLRHPANKLSGIYNMSAYVTYNGTPNGTSLILSPNQYKFGSTESAQAVTYEIAADWKVDSLPNLVMSEGVIQVNGYGDPIGNHRNITKDAGRSPNFTAVAHKTYFGHMPDVSIPITPTANSIDNKILHESYVTYYDLQGRRLSAPQRGLNIIKMADGTVRKIIMK